jgi:TolA-binding protein
MKRFGTILMTGLLALLAAGAETARAAQSPAQTPQQQQNQVQQLIADVYVTRFNNSVGLNDEQFLKVASFVRQFIQMRFRVANQRSILSQRRSQLLEQPEPPEAEVRQLSDDTAQLERQAGNMESNFVAKVRAELTPRQVLLINEFNRRFFDEDLPKLIESVRAEVAASGRRPAANGARNNRNAPLAPGDAFRGGQKR